MRVCPNEGCSEAPRQPEFRDDVKACPHCGTELVLPPAPAAPLDHSGSLVTVAAIRELPRAEVVAGTLRANGIEAYLIDHETHSTFSSLAGPVFPVRLQVPAEHAERARDVLGHADLGDEGIDWAAEDIGSAADETETVARVEEGRYDTYVGLGLLLSMIAVVLLPFLVSWAGAAESQPRTGTYALAILTPLFLGVVLGRVHRRYRCSGCGERVTPATVECEGCGPFER